MSYKRIIGGKEYVYLSDQEQIDELRAEMEAEKDKMVDHVMSDINAVTPIFAVSFVTTEGKEKHFANFYGTTIYGRLTQEEFEAKVQENDAIIYEMIGKLEEEINAGNFKKVQKDLAVEVNVKQFGGFMHKRIASIEDAIACDSVDIAFALFKDEYAKIGKTEKQSQKEELENFKRSLDILADILFD